MKRFELLMICIAMGLVAVALGRNMILPINDLAEREYGKTICGQNDAEFAQTPRLFQRC